MHTAIGIVIASAMSAAVLFLPLRVYRTAKHLGFGSGRRIRVSLFTFAFFGTWLVLVIFSSFGGVFQSDVPLKIFGLRPSYVDLFMFGPVMLGVITFSLFRTTRMIIDALSPHRLMFFETMRIVGGTFLFQYFNGGLPAVFALPAGLGDILVGITAPVMAYSYLKIGPPLRTTAIAWNIFGLLEFVVAVTIGHLYSVFQGGTATFPLVLIPTFGVPLMILIHLAALRVLVKSK